MRVESVSNAPRRLSVFAGSHDGERGNFRITSLLWMASIALLLVPITTLIDVPIARWFATDPLPGQLGDALDLSLVYAHGTGIFFILVSVILLAPRMRWHVPRMAVLAMGGGAVATITKMFVLRQRPNSIPNLEILGHDYAWNWSFDWTLQYVAYFDASTRAFPSAYLATATALTVGLCVVFPRGRWLFVSLCLSTMIQRMYCGSHFISDLFGSASVGLFWAFVCHHPSLLGNLFDKLEPEKSPRRARAILFEPVGQADDADHTTDRIAA
jgi:membrane-associated phospholipid phosphatase